MLIPLDTFEWTKCLHGTGLGPDAMSCFAEAMFRFDYFCGTYQLCLLPALTASTATNSFMYVVGTAETTPPLLLFSVRCHFQYQRTLFFVSSEQTTAVDVDVGWPCRSLDSGRRPKKAHCLLCRSKRFQPFSLA